MEYKCSHSPFLKLPYATNYLLVWIWVARCSKSTVRYLKDVRSRPYAPLGATRHGVGVMMMMMMKMRHQLYIHPFPSLRSLTRLGRIILSWEARLAYAWWWQWNKSCSSRKSTLRNGNYWTHKKYRTRSYLARDAIKIRFWSELLLAKCYKNNVFI